MVTAGLAKDVEEVNQYAAPIHAPTDQAACCIRPVRASVTISSSSPAVATASPSSTGPPPRRVPDTASAGTPNIASASAAPPIAPVIWQPITATASHGLYRPGVRRASQPVRRRDQRVEVRAAGRGEHHDQDGQAQRGHHRADQQAQRPVCGETGRGDPGPDDHGYEQACSGELSEQPPGRRAHAPAGLTARMVAECIPGAASWVKVTDASPNPAAARPARYSARDSAPAMHPT